MSMCLKPHAIIFLIFPYADEEDKKALVRDKEPDEYAAVYMPVLVLPCSLSGILLSSET